MGGGLAGLWQDGQPLLRPWSGHGADGPFALACNLLAPFSNRISGGFDRDDGRRIELAPNLQGEAFPIHGDAFQRPWDVAEAGAAWARLTLKDGAIGPWRYEAGLRCLLTRDRAELELTLTNLGESLPFGLGFHPWFPRTPHTTLRFAASGVWEENERHLPAGTAPVPLPPEWDFHEARPLPGTWINTAFAGWDRTLTIGRGPGARPLTLSAGAGLDTLLLYSPSAEAEFFCAEPVSHPVDAVNLPGRPGLRVLAPGEAMSGRMTLGWG
jgi:aldose 1-epimerase